MSDEARQLGRYQLLEEIGRGGYAIIYRARHETLQNEVALKLLSPGAAADADTRRRFIQEARTAAALSHPDIVRIDDLIEDGDQVYLIMEYLPGGNLRQWLVRHPNATWRERLALLEPVARALDYAHVRGVYHRDVKPTNILLDAAGRPRLADFGLVRLAAAPHLTQVGSVVGTPTYMSPEQAEGRPLDGRADQYSLAVIAYELLAGRPPFDGDSSTSTLVMHITQPPPPASSVSPAVPPEADQVLLQALEKKPAARYATCAAFLQALNDACAAAELRRVRELLAAAEQDLAAQRYVEMQQKLAEATALLPNRPELSDTLAQLEEARGRGEAYQKAAKEWQAAQQHGRLVLDLAPNHPDPQGVLADLGLRPPAPDPAERRRQIILGLLIGLPMTLLLLYLAFLWITRP